ncbi:MAG: DUF4339 domain-containing protein [Planctomycetes bacterium]|nr:DUF4339 domain-containing protein [Planctomycetota bacterium]
MEKWFYAVNEQRLGPVDAETIARLIRAGELSRTQLVWRKGLAAWTEAGGVDALAPLFPTPQDPVLLTMPPELPKRRVEQAAAAAPSVVAPEVVAQRIEVERPTPAERAVVPEPPALPPSEPAPEWYRHVSGAPIGPLAMEELQRLLRNGELRGADLVWRIGTPTWVSADSVEALRSALHSVPQRAASRAALRPNKLLGVTAAITLYGSLLVLGVAPLEPRIASAALVALPLAIAASLTLLRFVHQMWKAIDDGNSTIRPGAAAGLMLVPLFNLYWVFRAFPGFATELGRYAQRHGSTARPLGRGVLITYAVLFVIGLVPVLGVVAFLAQLVVAPITVVLVCNAIEAVHERQLAQSYVPARAVLA